MTPDLALSRSSCSLATISAKVPHHWEGLIITDAQNMSSMKSTAMISKKIKSLIRWKREVVVHNSVRRPALSLYRYLKDRRYVLNKDLWR